MYRPDSQPYIPIITGGCKFPTGHFMKWLQDKIDSKLIDFDFFYQKKRYLSDALDDLAINSWNNIVPVIISAQTGAGKNYFIQHVLLPYVQKKNTQKNSKKRILIVSNRVALNRQTKEQYLEEIKKYPNGVKYVETWHKNYTQDGQDSLCLDFGPLVICSYHQLHERNLLEDINTFSHIVCDEFHFFTSDAPFYKETDRILQEIVYKGRNAVRIYMSATPEIAIEAVLRCEYNTKYNMYSNGIKIAEYNAMQNEIQATANPFYSPKSPETVKHEIQINYFQLNVKYYHFKRDYSYINNFFSYDSLDDLLPAIKASSDKWLIFVSSKSEGRNLRDKINGIINSEEKELNNSVYINSSSEQAVEHSEPTKTKAFFLSREEINAAKDKDNNKNITEKTIYDDIIENEHFDCNVLIATSVLDNGINLKDNKIKHIVIDYYDQSEFVQMLGRVRIKNSIPSTNLNLYIHDYSYKELEKKINRPASNMVIRLYNDQLSKEARKKYYDEHNKLLRFSDDDTFSDYNTCAIYQAIHTIGQAMKFIKQKDPTFHIIFDDVKSNARMYSLLSYYMDGGGKNDAWARSIVDIFETPEGMKNRIYLKEDELSHNNFDDNYAYSYTKDFSSFLIKKLIMNTISNKLNKSFLSALEACPDSVKRSFYNEMNYQEHIKHRTPTIYDKVLCLNEKMKTVHQSLDLDYYEKLNNELIYYQKLLTSSNASSSVDVQLSWLGLTNATVTPIEENQCEAQSQDKMTDEMFYNRFIKDKAVTRKELEQHRTTAKDPAYKASFLQSHGMNRGETDEAECAKFFNRSSLTVVSGKDSPINFIYNGIEYTLKKVNAARNEKKTFYIWLKPE